MTTATPIYTTTITEQGIVPENIYARCSALVAFTWNSAPVRRTPVAPPAPGARPVNRNKRKKNR